MKKPTSPLLIFDRIQDMYQMLNVPVETANLKSEFTIYDLGKFGIPANFRSPVYRANFFSFVFVKDAWGRCSSDANWFDLQPGIVYFNNPGHIKEFVVKEMKSLFMLTLSEAFLKENVHANIFDEFPFLLSETVPPRLLPGEQFEELEELYLQIQKAYRSGSPYRNKLIGHLFVAILIKIREAFWKGYSPVDEGDRASQIVRKFKHAMEKHYRELSKGQVEKVNRVQEYADILNLHPNYLNTVIKTKTGKSVGTWISEKTIAEAKALLKNSNMPVKEISYRLGFAEIQNFSTYFKKHTKSTPVYYRSGLY